MNSERDLVIEFDPSTFADILVATHLCEVEISGLAKVERDGRKFRVFDGAIVVNQKCSLFRTEPDTEALNLWFHNIALTGNEEQIQNMESQSLWWHSHVKSSVDFSGQDFRTMRILLSMFKQWWLVLVTNQQNQSRLALIEKNDGHLKYEEAPLGFNPEITSEEFRALCRSKVHAIRRLINERVIVIRNRE